MFTFSYFFLYKILTIYLNTLFFKSFFTIFILLVYFSFFVKSLQIFYNIFIEIIYFFLSVDVFFILFFLYICDYKKHKVVQSFYNKIQKFLIEIDFFLFKLYLNMHLAKLFVYFYIVCLISLFLFGLYVYNIHTQDFVNCLFLSVIVVFVYLRILNFPFHFLRVFFFVECFIDSFYDKMLVLQSIPFNSKFGFLFSHLLLLRRIIKKHTPALITKGGVTYITGISLFSYNKYVIDIQNDYLLNYNSNSFCEFNNYANSLIKDKFKVDFKTLNVSTLQNTNPELYKYLMDLLRDYHIKKLYILFIEIRNRMLLTPIIIIVLRKIQQKVSNEFFRLFR